MTFIDGNDFRVYLLPRACSWMATEMAEVSNRVNFGISAGHLRFPEKSRQREYPMILGLVWIKVQFKGPEIYKKKGALFQEESDLATIFMSSFLNLHTFHLTNIAF